jgi:hypothetical protein
MFLGAEGAARASEKPAPCRKSADLQTAATTGGNAVPEGGQVLAFDHRTGKWTVCERKGSELVDSTRIRVERLLDDRPRLYLSQGTPFAVFVVETNPMLYGVEAGASTETKIDSLDDLQKFATLLGGVAAGGIEGLGAQLFQAESTVGEFEVSARRVVPPDWEVGFEKAKTKPCSVVPQPPADAYGRAVWRLHCLNEALRAEITVVQGRMATVKARVSTLKGALGEISSADASTREWLQTSELAEQPTERPDKLAQPVDWPNANFAALRTGIQEARSIETSFSEKLSKLRNLLATRLCTETPKQLPPCGRSEFEYWSLLDELDPPAAGVTVPAGSFLPVDPSRELQDQITWVARHLRSFGLTATLTPEQRLFAEGADLAVREALATLESATEAIDAAEKALVGEDTARKAVALLHLIGARYEGICPSTPCALSVLRVPRHEGETPDLSWSKIRTESFTVEAPAPAKDLALARPAKREFKYELADAATAKRRFALDYALLYTEVHDESFGAVAANPSDPNDKSKVIAVTERDTRAGEPALFLTWAIHDTGPFRMGPQLGVAVDSTNLAAYLGWSFRWRVVGIGAGWGAHRLNQLDGQSVGDPVTGPDDIQTKKEFETDLDSWYLSLTISLSDLSFFRPAK